MRFGVIDYEGSTNLGDYNQSFGVKYIYKYPDQNGNMTSGMQCPAWENELRDRVIQIVKGIGQKIDENKDSKIL